MTYADYIAQLRDRWIGKQVLCPSGAVHTVVDVDYNGGLLLDKPARFTQITAVDPCTVSPYQAIEI